MLRQRGTPASNLRSRRLARMRAVRHMDTQGGHVLSIFSYLAERNSLNLRKCNGRHTAACFCFLEHAGRHGRKLNVEPRRRVRSSRGKQGRVPPHFGATLAHKHETSVVNDMQTSDYKQTVIYFARRRKSFELKRLSTDVRHFGRQNHVPPARLSSFLHFLTTL